MSRDSCGLREIGCEINLASANLSSETPWNCESVKILESTGLKRVSVYETSEEDMAFVNLLWSYFAVENDSSAQRGTKKQSQWLNTAVRKIDPHSWSGDIVRFGSGVTIGN